MLLASILLQSAVNMFNEYYDYRRGLDHAGSVGIGGAIVERRLAADRVFQLGVAFASLALLLGVRIMQVSSWWIFPWALGCFLVGYLYSGGPCPISATPLGELAAGSCMGTGIISIAYFIHTMQLPLTILLVSGPPSIMIGAILMANNIRDLDDDRAHGRKTVAVLCGKKPAIYLLSGMFMAAQLGVTAMVVWGWISPWTLLVLLSLPKCQRAVREFRQGTSPQEMMPAMVATAQANTLFGLLLTIGLMIAAIT